MSIRTKIALVLVGAVILPLAISMLFWTLILRQMVGVDIRVWTLLGSRREREARINSAFQNSAASMTRRSTAATARVGEAARQLTRGIADLGDQLERLRCERAAPPAACDTAVRVFLERYAGDVEGVRVRLGDRTQDVLQADVVGERAAATVATIASLERERGELTLRPAALDEGWLLVTRRTTGAGPVTAWGVPDRLREDLQRASGRSMQVGLVGPDGDLLYPLSFQPRGIPSFDLPTLRRGQGARTVDLPAWLAASSAAPVEIDERRYALRYTPIPGAGLGTVTLALLDAGLQERVVEALVKYLGLTLALIAIAFVGSGVLANRLTGRLRRLRVAADEIGAGRLDTEIEVAGRDEVGRLAERFRIMAGQLREHITTLEQRVDDRTRDLRLKAEELARANEDLVRLTKLKSDFLARMSHELRTPLNSIIGFSELLRAEGCGPVNEEQRDGLERVVRNGKNLLQLINDILDISKIEADRLTLKFGPASLRGVVDNAVSSMMLRASTKKIALTAAVDPDVPTLYTDEVRLLQIVNNLLSNAVKFTRQGGVTLTARAGGGDVVIAVQDTGIGIAADDLPKLFTEFYQTDVGKAREFDGTGLGLAITKRLTEALGGAVTVTSDPGVGSTFTVTLPVVAPGAETEAATAAATREAEQAVGPRRSTGPPIILIVDDDPATHRLVTENLKPLGARFLGATTGAAGLEMARARHPDLILLDVRLPDRQGWEVLHDLKADPATIDIPVIVVSVVDRESLGFSLGAADYIVKPVNWDHLYKVLGRLGIAPTGGDVLVVDDDPESVALLRRALESRGFTVRTAADGVQGLAAARERRPGLVVLDLMMPVMDGFDALTHLRADARTAGVPVVVLTAKDLTDDDRARLGGKADALFQKHRVPLDQLAGEVRARMWKASQA